MMQHTAAPRTAPAIAELAGRDQWVISKPVRRRGKLDKPPFSPIVDVEHKAPWMCSHSEPSHWASYDAARTALTSYSFLWLGFVFHESDPYSGIDLDGCRDPQSGAIEDWAQRIIDWANSYTEISPSETGVKIFVRGKLAESINHSLGAHKGIEVYSKQRYFTVTGRHLPGSPLEIRDAQSLLDELQREYAPSKIEPKPARPAKVISLAPRAGRLSARDTIDQANRANDLGTYLESKGATLVRAAGDVRYYSSIAGEKHDHSITYIVSPAKDGAGYIGYSYSPNGKLNNVDFRRGFRSFDAYTALDQAGDTEAALKAFSPTPAPRKRREEPPPTEPERPRYSQAEREAYNAACRERRHAENLTTLDNLSTQACALDFRPYTPPATNALRLNPDLFHERAHKLLAHLYDLCQASGRLQCAPVNVYLAAELEMCESYVKLAFHALEAAGLGKRQGGRGGFENQPNEAATWTFYRSPNLGVKPHQDAIYPLDYRDLDLVSTLEACEPAPSPALAGEPDAWELWQACDPECSGYDLALEYDEQPPSAEIESAPAPVEPPTIAPVLQVEPRPWRVEHYGARWALRGPAGECSWFGSEGAAQQALAAMTPAADGVLRANWRKPGFDDSDLPEIAVYDPTGAGQVEQHPAECASAIVEISPLVEAPPSTSHPTYSAFITAWYASQPGAVDKRTGKPRSAGQRDYLRREAQRYLVDVSPEEAARRWEALNRRESRSERPGAGLRAAHKLAPAAPPSAQQTFFGTGGQYAEGPPLSAVGVQPHRRPAAGAGQARGDLGRLART